MNIVIVGLGAVGTALAADLWQSAGLSAHWLGRGGFFAEVRSVRHVTGEFITVKPRPVEGTAVSADIVFVATRAFDVVAAITELPNYVLPGASVVTLNNGYLANEIADAARRVEGIFEIRIGMTSLSALLDKDNQEWRITNPDPSIVFGPLTQEAKISASEAAFCEVYPRAKLVREPLPYVRKKWLYNVVINSLSAYYRLANNGALLGLEDEVNAVFEEGFEWAQQHWGRWPWDRNELHQELWRLIRLTATNKNSMVRDLAEGRALETPFLAGIVKGDTDRYPWMKKLASIER